MRLDDHDDHDNDGDNDGDDDRARVQGSGAMILLGVIGILVIIGFLYSVMAQ
ncbi:hypothetical protein Daura_17975 [Dactylosporangium aurantiacum]|uniref:Uncharacterized protein n=1 Tax=Dactylosporangium aurantiacum TaxID=35754 RepID=A0A9Q9IMV5_9ACTN|nr:hypothetical protein [Dactylosporangium aurantiacum]MDG6105943.1 hypothetical protein [Dactylosporangium aurantiacum]UWZ57888.1 hypothetical protein Daura_17975 [Dactylosporangium aurantiacum]